MRAFWKRRRREIAVGALAIADSAGVFAVFAVAYWLRYHAALAHPARPGFALYVNAAVAVSIIWVAVFARFDLYRTRRTWRSLDLVFAAAGAVSVGMIAFLAMAYLRQEFRYSRLMLVGIWGMGITSTVAIRLVARLAIVWLYAHGVGIRRLVMVGDSVPGRALVRAIERHPELGYEVAGHLRPGGGNGDGAGGGERWEGARRVVEELRRRGIDDVVLTIPVGASEELREFIALCHEHGLRTRVVPDVYELYSPRTRIMTVEGIPLLGFRERSVTLDDALKRGLDLSVAVLVLVLAAPVLPLVVGFRREAWANALQRQMRGGLEGRPFGRLRFVGAGRKWTGRPIIRTLPSFVNVLRGEMSLVGPRPCSREDGNQLNQWQRRRQLVRPGLTGLAQLEASLGERISPGEVELDLVYIEQRSFAVDLKILLRALWLVLRGGVRPPRERSPRRESPTQAERLQPDVEELALTRSVSC